ncbi:MAG: SRPBCC family protein [Actinomycetota bacterium]|jgi:uncharacterized protein YndB with AHSA1/START domain|nr:SRPBCC family protein [Actinomycetota bacterium]
MSPDAPDVEVTVEIAAPRDRVWELIGDPARMAEWSPECDRVTWIGSASTPSLGARFRGHNSKGWRRWTTTGTVITFEEGRAVAWHVDFLGSAVADWGYRLEDTPDGGTRVTGSFTDRRTGLIAALGRPARGVSDTPSHNRAGITATLERVRAAAEASGTPGTR